MYRKYENPLSWTEDFFQPVGGSAINQQATNLLKHISLRYMNYIHNNISYIQIIQIYNKNSPWLWISAIHYYNPMVFMGIPGYLLDPLGIFQRCLRLGAAYESCLLHRLPTPSAVEFGPGRQGGKTRCTSTRWFGRQWEIPSRKRRFWINWYRFGESWHLRWVSLGLCQLFCLSYGRQLDPLEKHWTHWTHCVVLKRPQ